MGLLDTPLRAVAKSLMHTFGTSATVRRVLGGQYNTTTGKAVETIIDQAVEGILEEYEAREIGDTVKMGDRKFSIAAADLNFTPSPEDRVLFGTKVYRIVRVGIVQATDDAALFTMQLRGGP